MEGNVSIPKSNESFHTYIYIHFYTRLSSSDDYSVATPDETAGKDTAFKKYKCLDFPTFSSFFPKQMLPNRPGKWLKNIKYSLRQKN